MKKAEAWRYVIVTGMIACTLVLVEYTGTVEVDDSLPVKSDLPRTIDGWVGVRTLYCQNEVCGKMLPMNLAEAGVNTCPLCGAKVSSMSVAERKHLPVDTIIIRKNYRNESTNRWILVSVVISGRERSSIHRPEWCLPGQGYRIAAYRHESVACEDHRSLPVTFIKIQAPGSLSTLQYGWFCYWFISKTHEVGSQTARLAWMAWDNVFYGVFRKWAYVSILADRVDSEQEEYDVEILKDFIKELRMVIRP